MKDEEWKKKLEWLATQIELKGARYHDKPTKVTRILQRRDGFSKEVSFERHGITEREIAELAHLRFAYVIPRSISMFMAVDRPIPYDSAAHAEFYPRDCKVTETDERLDIVLWYDEI